MSNFKIYILSKLDLNKIEYMVLNCVCKCVCVRYTHTCIYIVVITSILNIVENVSYPMFKTKISNVVSYIPQTTSNEL